MQCVTIQKTRDLQNEIIKKIKAVIPLTPDVYKDGNGKKEISKTDFKSGLTTIQVRAHEESKNLKIKSVVALYVRSGCGCNTQQVTLTSADNPETFVNLKEMVEMFNADTTEKYRKAREAWIKMGVPEKFVPKTTSSDYQLYVTKGKMKFSIHKQNSREHASNPWVTLQTSGKLSDILKLLVDKKVSK